MRSVRAEQAEFPEYAGQYRLKTVLGSGGMGVVHLADSASGLKLAVKVVHAEHAVDPEFRARFRQEIAAARRVSGAFTAPVVDADPDAERPWMATLFIDAPTLAERVREQVLDGPEVARLGAGLAEALRDIHRAGVVHRDLKPSNVLMAADGPKVIDFGISRPYDSELRTETGKLIGTPPFMAPEQFQRPREVGPAADVFAMGSVLVHAATGRGPFDSDSPYIVAYQVVHDEPELSGVPARLEPIIERCLAKEPAERPSADELIVALREAAYATSDDTRAFIPQPRRPVAAESVAPAEEVTHQRVQPPEGPSPAPGGPGGRGRKRRLVLSLAVGLLLVGGAVGGYLWSGTGPDPSGRAEAPAGRSAKRSAPWAVTLGGRGTTGGVPACSWASGGLYCSAAGTLAARLEPADGTTRWTVPGPPSGIPGTGSGAPLTGGGPVLVAPEGANTVRALDPATGGQRWKRDVPVGGRVLPAGAHLLIATVDGAVTGLDAGSGAQRWSRHVGGPGSVWLTRPDGGRGRAGSPTLYAATRSTDGSSTQVQAIDPADGSALWTVRVPGVVEPAGATQDSLVLLAKDARSRTTAVVRVDQGDRTVRRTALAVPLQDAEAAVGPDGLVYAAGTTGTLVAVGPDGESWRLQTGASLVSAPVFADGRVFLLAMDGRLLAVDARAGRLLGQTKPRMVAGQTYTMALPAPVVAGGRVFGAAPDGSVFAVDAGDPGRW
ncbi:serine/threonine-protein kinase [Streptomyces sp. NPDC089799]|uniref:serine/threonine-protein kinase n=1 Tax=Streptomyces sp. NPDC089799 TaxID=3155066 RepID=UPI00344010F2